MGDLIERIEIGEETFEDRIAVAQRFSCNNSAAVDSLFENVQTGIDAVDRLLPGADISLQTCGAHVPGWEATVSEQYPEEGEPWLVGGFGETPARALLVALLKTLDRDNG